MRTHVLGTLLQRLSVIPDGPAVTTASSTIVFGRRLGAPVVVKVAATEEERRGARLLASWSGRGAVRVLAATDDAVLLERATGLRDLAAMTRTGADLEAAEVLATTAARLHRIPPPDAEVGLVPLRTWFAALLDREQGDPLLAVCASTARDLLEGTAASDVVALHGDLHHANVLDAGTTWIAIDPKGLLGHRAFDFANALVNPDERAPALLIRRLALVARVAGIDEEELRAWTLAWCGLSLAWHGATPSWHARSCRGVASVLLDR